MVKYLIALSICILSVIVLLGCREKVSSEDLEPKGSDVPQAESIVTHGGKGRMGVSWLAAEDKIVSEYEVFWYSVKSNGSQRNAVPNPDDSGRVQIILKDIVEGSYLLELFLYDKQGNASSKASAAGTVYGSVYQAGLIDHAFQESKTLDHAIALRWAPARDDLYATEVKYTDSEGASVLHSLPGDSTRDTLRKTRSNQRFQYRALYLPDSNAIDTFYTDYRTAQVGPGYAYTLHQDAASNTSYYITRIHHLDKSGNPIELRLAHTVEEEGETVREFAARSGSLLAFNASTQVKFEDNPSKRDVPSTVTIVEGEIITNAPRDNRYTLGIKDNNELVVFDPGTTAEDILSAGVSNAVTAFVPLILDHKPVSDQIMGYVGNLAVKHPRQVIAQLDNLDILFLTTGGRGYGGQGMTGKEVIQILQDLNVKFAYNLDGGGSTSLVVNGEFINWKMDKNGTQERKRPTFLYIK